LIEQGGRDPLGSAADATLLGQGHRDCHAAFGSTAQVPGNAVVEAYVPYAELFPHTDLLVSNGGYGGTLQALGFGIPLVLAGASEDKVEVNARLAWSGAAVDLRTARPGIDAVRAAVDTVLTGPRYRERAAAIRDEIVGLDPLGAVVEAISDVRDGRR
jgi:UDP:flavonoid glycosyltransferase YjiC (YdhE family)